MDAGWDTQKETSLLTLVQTQITNGQQTDNGNLKKQGWAEIVRQLERVYGARSRGHWESSAKNCYSKLKCRWMVYKKLLS
jgi:hypothetical protein